MTTRLLLLRHAQTAAPELFHGSESDVGLGPKGFEQAQAIAPILCAEKPDYLYSSGMRRALETVEPIARACGLVPTVLPTLHERSMGPLSGTAWSVTRPIYEDSLHRWSLGELDATHEGGESYVQIHDRLMPRLTEILQTGAGRTSVLVVHGVVIRVLLTSAVEGIPLADLEKIAIDNCGVYDLRWNSLKSKATLIPNPNESDPTAIVPTIRLGDPLRS